jgi:hypothetical protein
MELVEKEVPSIDDRYDTWLAFAQTWAQLNMLADQVALAVTPNTPR